jgi:hypothetical protein
METRHQNIIPIYDLIIVHLPLKQVCLNLLGEALTNPRDMPPLRVGSIHGSLIEDETEGITETF